MLGRTANGRGEPQDLVEQSLVCDDDERTVVTHLETPGKRLAVEFGRAPPSRVVEGTDKNALR
ncbi:hypothetical protein Atai01_52360 [Amycolatopsis taiwanensis]|uniref:Uncharacterized protein n=1 Tax=Amycolatopsis taiwanensis TaxID=342230 RepID=A0A9W6VIN0_9PSEU|nr:hypothetical protein Atai01_52360 [Amycolatopsis taiwanensis]